ncbi:RNA polymerase sigma-G factor [Halolactibacillus miurensis]|uniref:RNA polymerase sigma factor n=1 Tax=Halolactibacillus miurensis TaxID=306541 RepID=A0A1I6QAU4_9BACI|nr:MULTISPECIES: RNA polymerase sporulation sigma factor SigG [Halolactibacillus]GEM03508.1 RNA polymerase sigma-G factor [Halolactibacillus miurensis]SFS49576.1 RNA polymerase sporulation-specific sigma factor [Halolactibacillus miurensis]
MARFKVDLCGVDTKALPVLKNEDMRILFKRYQAGDQTARETIIGGNLRLVLSIIQRFQHRGESGDDLFQVGCIGLIKAIDNFDLKHNVKFSTYAVPMILGEVRRHFRDHQPIRVSRSIKDLAYQIMKTREKLMNERHVEPTLKEVSEVLGVKLVDVVFALDAIQEPMSLFDPIYDDGSDPVLLMDQVTSDKEPETDWVMNLALKQSLDGLNKREFFILNKRYYEGLTQSEVADEIGISQAQVSRLEKQALKAMKQKMKEVE